MKRKLIALGLVLVMAVSLLAGCSNKEAASTNDASEVTLAIVGPQTGDNAEYGKSMKTAAQIAVTSGTRRAASSASRSSWSTTTMPTLPSRPLPWRRRSSATPASAPSWVTSPAVLP